MPPNVNLVERVVRTMVVPQKVKNPEERVHDLKTSIKAVKATARKKRFFGFETVSDSAEEAVQKMEAKIKRLQMFQKGFPELDYSFLGWRKKNTKLPAFMVIDLDKNTFKLGVEPMGRDFSNRLDLEASRSDFEPDLPVEIEEQYRGTINYLLRLAVRSHDWDRIEIEAEYRGGVMPDDLRTKVKDVGRRRLFDEIFVIAEAPSWKINTVARTKSDPLVVGWLENTAQMFLIGAFDPTPLERYVEEQFIK